MDVFIPIRPKRLYAQIVEQIVDLTKRGEFPAGAQLPPERELAQRLGTSRASLREALTVLQILGLVETESGQGTLVSSERVSPFLRFDTSWLYYDEESPFDILQARKTLEHPIAALAARQRCSAALKYVGEIQDLVDTDPGDRHVFNEGDRRLHLAIAEIAGHHVLLRMMWIVYELMGQKLWLSLRDSTLTTPERLQEYGAQHRRIYEAIKAQDGQAAAARMREHLDSVEQLMIEAELVPDSRLVVSRILLTVDLW
jgi:GntR family transcriptional repressor for pyruvate dehydrogenase complex